MSGRCSKYYINRGDPTTNQENAQTYLSPQDDITEYVGGRSNQQRKRAEMNVYDLLINMWRSASRHDNRKQVRELIDNLALVAEHDPDCTFIYRGESECHERVSSGLFRQFYKLDDESFDITEAQDRQLKIARAYVKDESDPDNVLAQIQHRGGKTNFIDFTAARAYAKDESNSRILAQIQHRGGKTNLIDFTADLNVALFFACNYSPCKHGRVIFLHHKQWDDYCIKRAIQPSNMADVQKSYFVDPKRGYIKDEDITIYKIPRELKAGILRHLRIVYGIEPSTVYNDLSGFIRDQDLFPDFEADFLAGQRCFCNKDYEKAVKHYTKGLQNPTVQFKSSQGIVFPNVYRQRGIANYYAGNRADALNDLQIFDFHGGDWTEKPEIPEEIRKWYNINKGAQQEEKGRPRDLQRANDAATAADLHSIWIDAQDTEGNLVDGARFKLLSEGSYEDSREIQNGSVQVNIPGECHGRKCLFWFNMDGYRGVNPVQVQLGDSFTATLKPIERNSGAPAVTIEVSYERTEAT